MTISACVRACVCARGRKLAMEARRRIVRDDDDSLIAHASSLTKERDLFAIKDKDNELWSSTVTKLQKTTLPLQWVHQWTPFPTTLTSAVGENCHLTCAQSVGRLGDSASKPWLTY